MLDWQWRKRSIRTLMKRSHPSFHRLAATTTSFETAYTTAAGTSMSYRPHFGGGRGRGRRNYSDRPSGDGRDHQEISRDSDFRSVQDTNRGFQPYRGGSFSNFQSQPPPSFGNRPPNYSACPPPPNLYSNQQFHRPRLRPFYGEQLSRPPPPQPGRPHLDHNQQFHRPRPPPFYGEQFSKPPPPHPGRPHLDHNQRFQPRPQPPKALNFRVWEHAEPEPPPYYDRFTVLSYNILADYLVTNHWRKLYFHIPRHMLDWQWRKRSIIFELGLWSADILCLQEVDRFQDLEAELQLRGYSGIWKMRTGDAVDGCAIFWRGSRFKLLQEDSIEFRNHGLRDNVAQICVFELLDQHNGDGSTTSSTRSSNSNKVVICNIHVLFNPRRGEMKLGQIRLLLDRAEYFSKLWDGAPIVICGDFNSMPKSPLYNFLVEQKLDILEVPRDKVSGQESATLNLPKRSPPVNWAQSLADSVKDKLVDLESSSKLNVRTQSPEIESGEGLSRGCESQTQNSVVNESNKSFVGVHFEDRSREGSVENSHDSNSDLSDPISVSKDISCNEGSAPNTHEFNNTSELADAQLDKKMENLSLGKVFEGADDPFLGEDSEMFLSELCGATDPFSSESTRFRGSEFEELDEQSQVSAVSHLGEEILYDDPDADSVAVDIEKSAYDPSAWTPIEIQTATGSVDCTVMEHNLKLRSVYREVEDVTGTRDSTGEPEVTSYHSCFLGTVDYIWRSEGLQTVRVLAPIPKQAMQWVRGFPTKKWGSDHIALVSELAFTKDFPVKDAKVE